MQISRKKLLAIVSVLLATGCNQRLAPPSTMDEVAGALSVNGTQFARVYDIYLQLMPANAGERPDMKVAYAIWRTKRESLRHRAMMLGAGAFGNQVVSVPHDFPEPEGGGPETGPRLSLVNNPTGERFEGLFRTERGPATERMRSISRLMRDFRRNEVMPIDPGLINLLGRLTERLSTPGKKPPVIHILSGYRSPETNAELASRLEGVSQHSLHMQGRAVDIYIEGVPIARLRDEAVTLKGGGVGFYPHSGFIHIDTGRVRYWEFGRPPPSGTLASAGTAVAPTTPRPNSSIHSGLGSVRVTNVR